MAYHQRLHHEGPLHSHYHPQYAGYTAPLPQGPGQRHSDSSKRRFESELDYQHGNGASSMRPYAEQNRNINGHVWQNMSHHQERGQPMYYQPNHGELQVMNYQRQVCTHGSGNLYSSNKEPSIRGQDQGETNGPVLGGRLMQSQKKEPAVTQHFQPKHIKQSIIPQPTSPISTAWDNPFPTFPSSRSKPKVMENKTLSDDLAEMRLDGPTGKPHLPHDCDNQNQGTSRSHEFEQYRVEASPGAHDYRARGSEAQQQGRAEFERTIPALTQHSVQTLHSRSAYDVRSAAQASRDERPQYLPSQNNIGYSAPPLPSDGASTTGSQRSMTLPGQSTAPRSKFEHHQRYPGATGWQEPGPTGAYHGSRSQSIIPQRPATSMELRVADGVHPPSDEMNRSSNSGAEGIAMPDYGMVHPRKYSLDDFFDSYSGAPPQDPIQQPNNHERWLSVEAEMPDFDVAPVTWAAESRDIAFAQPVQPHGSAPTVPFTHPSVLESAGVDEALYVPESDSQSKFQPGHQTENQSSPDSRAGFIFELAGDIPVVPQRVQDSLHGRAANHYETNGNVMSKEQYILRSSQHNERAMRPGIPAHGTVGSFNGRPEDDWQRRFHHHRASPRAPKFEISGPGPDYEHRTIQPQSLPSPINRLVSAHSPISRPANPNALSEHPTPVRPGLMQGILGNQIPKPPPVRQYDSNVTPTQQQGPTQQATSARNLQKKALPAPVTVDELERLKQVVKVNPKDHKTQLILAKKLAEAAAVLADEGGRADPKTRNKNREKYVFDAHKIIKRLVSSGNSDAMFYLADCHGRGLLGLEIDDKEAFTLYQSAAKAGHAQSAYRVAVCCEMGQEGGGGTRRDPLKAMQWYKRAAMLGDTPAMYKMGMILLKGHLGQPRNSREAIVWLKRAADRADEENPHALHELGLLYENASGNDHIIRDEEYSKQLFTQAAELGYKFSQFRLGCAYEYGLMGCAIDPRQSISWYSRAAIQGEHQSELALSGWYLTGTEGVLQQSDTEAYLWARKAAHAGLAKAEYAMGYFTEVGIGAPANIEDAKRWYWRAASQNFSKARERLEDLRKGGAKMQKSRVSRSAVCKQSEGDCVVM